MGEIKANDPVLVRVHMENSLCDILPSSRKGCGWPLEDIVKRIAAEGKGIVVILRSHETSADIIDRVDQYRMLDAGKKLAKRQSGDELRTYGLGAQILKSIGVNKMTVMSSPKKIHGLSGFGLEVVEYYTGE
jgi:3,4-dihydroxy 2-butanone 4-phosphate synthase / GTP cyclohydrolase II